MSIDEKVRKRLSQSEILWLEKRIKEVNALIEKHGPPGEQMPEGPEVPPPPAGKGEG